MRNISFALTEPQIVAGTKTVTRRLGWRFLKSGDQLQPVKKCMGLKPGEKIQRIRGPIRVVSVRRESLSLLDDDTIYGVVETNREGFSCSPSEFVKFFCESHKGCTPHSEVTRIEFEYL